MKKTLCTLLALVLALSCGAAALADDPDEVPGTVVMPYGGIRFVPPEAYRNTRGTIVTDGCIELARGINYAYWVYYPIAGNETESPDPEKKAVLFDVFTLRSGISFGDFNTLAGGTLSEQYARELGQAGDYTFYLYMKGPDAEFADTLDPESREEYTALAGAVDDVAAAITLSVPEERPDPYEALVGTRFEFTATDLDGNEISSADLFAQNEVTVLNLWATWCGPCIGELGALQELYTKLQEKGCGIVGMLVMDEDLESAKALAAENGLTYPVIQAPDTLPDYITLKSVPVTLFFGRDGTMIAAPVSGAHVEEYEKILETLFSK